MSNQMSTSINNLPIDTSSAPPVNTDPIVTDVLAEMEREVAAAQRPSPQQRPPQQHHTSMPPPQPYGNQQMPMLLPPYMKEPGREWIDMSKLQTAVIASIIAVLLLIPNVSFIYERIQRLAPFQSYELFIRVGLLAIVLYIAMLKLNI